jgi:hypothetical protein
MHHLVCHRRLGAPEREHAAACTGATRRFVHAPAGNVAAGAVVWLSVCTGALAFGRLHDILLFCLDCLSSIDHYKPLFVLYVYLYTSCQCIYICHMFYLSTHYFFTSVQNHFDILNTKTFLYVRIERFSFKSFL